MNELSDRIKTTIESEDVVLFMKGTPEQVLCGNSARALEALRSVGASVAAVDVLPDPAIRQELSALSNWPTIPQVFVRGELVGGADNAEALAASGALRGTLDDSLGDGWDAAERNERVVEVTDGGPTHLRLVP